MYTETYLELPCISWMENSIYKFKSEMRSSCHSWNIEAHYIYSGGQQKNCRGETIKSTPHVFSQMVMGKSNFFLDASGTGLKWHPLFFYTVAELSHREFTSHLQTPSIPGHSRPPRKIHGEHNGVHLPHHVCALKKNKLCLWKCVHSCKLTTTSIREGLM